MNRILIIVCLLMAYAVPCELYSQIYETEELRKEAEMGIAAKKPKDTILQKKDILLEPFNKKTSYYIPEKGHYLTSSVDVVLKNNNTKKIDITTKKEAESAFLYDYLAIDFVSNQFWVLKKQNLEIKHVFKFKLTNNTITLDCNCNIPPMNILSKTTSTLSLEIPNQDLNADFNFIYILQNEE